MFWMLGHSKGGVGSVLWARLESLHRILHPCLLGVPTIIDRSPCLAMNPGVLPSFAWAAISTQDRRAILSLRIGFHMETVEWPHSDGVTKDLPLGLPEMVAI